jgi:glycosyltransferase involved in cell wall biosynthesis
LIHDFKPDAIFVLSLGFVRYAMPFIAGKFSIYNEYHTSYYGFYLGYRQQSWLGKIKSRLTYKLIDFIESRYTKIIFLNDAEFNHYKRKNSVIIPNFFDEIKQPPQLPKKNQAISLGRLCYQKGYDLLIDAWEIVANENTGWTMEIYGNGEDHDALQKQISAKNLQHGVHLNPATDAVNEKLSESGFYVMSSRFETFPMVLLEAMSNGLPVVSFDCPTGPASMLTPNEDGFLVKDGGIQALAQKIIEMIREAELRHEMGQKALENVKRFNPKAVMKQWDDLIRNNLKK